MQYTLIINQYSTVDIRNYIRTVLLDERMFTEGKLAIDDIGDSAMPKQQIVSITFAGSYLEQRIFEAQLNIAIAHVAPEAMGMSLAWWMKADLGHGYR